VNPSFEEMTGYTAEEVIGKTPRILQGPETDRAVLDVVRSHLEQGKRLTNTTTVNYRKDGTPFWVEWNIAPVRGPDGAVEHWVSVQRDVTEQRERKQKLHEERQRLELALEGGRLGMWDWNMNTEEGTYDARWAAMLGYEPEEVDAVEAFFESRVHPDDLERISDAIQRHAVGELSHIEREIRMRHKDGSWRWILARAKIMEWNADGSPRRVVGTHMDITEQKRQEATEQRLGRLLEATPSEIYVFEAETLRFVQTSRGAQENLGYSGEELSEMTPLDLNPYDRAAFEDLIAPLRAEENELVTFETTHRRKDGTRYPVQARLQLSRAEDPSVFIAIVLDITERKRRERELLVAKEHAEEMNRLKSAFLANMSHELRTPLTSIIGFADVLQGQVEGETQELLEMIRQSGKRLEETLTSVLDLAKIEGESVRVQSEPVDFAAEVRTAADLFRLRAEAKHIDLTVDVPRESDPGTVDSRLLRRVLSNLISNAIKFTEEGQVTVRLRARPDTAIIEVEDTGVGIAPEQVERIFEEFVQESEGYTRSYEGTGLGLSITRRLVNLLGGQIDVESEKGVGSLFRVTLPREHAASTSEPPDEPQGSSGGLPTPPDRTAEADGGPPTPDRPPAPSTASSARGDEHPPEEARPTAQGNEIRVLLVEDNKLTRQVLPMLLRQIDERYVVDTTVNAEEALARADTTHYDLFLIDINFGTGPTGLDVMRRLRDQPRYQNTPMVACTAYAMPADRQTFLEAGFDAYLAKPFRAQKLLETLQHVLDREGAPLDGE